MHSRGSNSRFARKGLPLRTFRCAKKADEKILDSPVLKTIVNLTIHMSIKNEITIFSDDPSDG
jgi:hypothetical protein